MAFQLNNNQGNQAQGNVTEDKWKAVGFLNVYLPANDGTRVKLGAIPLRLSKPREKELAEWLAQDVDDVRMGKLQAKLEIEYGSAEASESKGFDLT